MGSADQTAMQNAFEHLMALQRPGLTVAENRDLNRRAFVALQPECALRRAALGLLESLQSGSIRHQPSGISFEIFLIWQTLMGTMVRVVHV